MYIHGIDVLLYMKTELGSDEFGAPIYKEVPHIVENVLPIQPTSDEMAAEFNLSGKYLTYVLCIPKGDANNWEDRKVEFFGKTFQTIGKEILLVDDLVPGDWNKRIKVALYE